MVSYFPQEINPTFNLPDFNNKIPLYDSTATIGNSTNGKAPNITGSLEGGHNFLDGDGKSVSGAFGFFVGSKRQKAWASSYNSEYGGFNFDASRSSVVYDNGATGIIPAGIYVLSCIKY